VRPIKRSSRRVKARLAAAALRSNKTSDSYVASLHRSRERPMKAVVHPNYSVI
jgi:hypothetical protein